MTFDYLTTLAIQITGLLSIILVCALIIWNHLKMFKSKAKSDREKQNPKER